VNNYQCETTLLVIARKVCGVMQGKQDCNGTDEMNK
jgi:hypothetical protein